MRRVPNLIAYPLVLVAIGCSWVWPDRSIAAAFIGVPASMGIVLALLPLGFLFMRTASAGILVDTGDMKLVIAFGAVLG